ncbi:hypothetical protein MLD38_040261 [Melastoma candidum]|uniref:Uncharacterized protein n=1 Tax=Melastoma candidum TaxID=119954 RepID=A0ACB9L5V6_9MYRT|nr:hypothetical protein MLD38_040261 [Melastoma candidum]
MGKNEKTGLGRVLVKHHNQMIQQSKEKGRFLRNQHKKVRESIADVSDIDAVIHSAEESDRFSDLPHASPADPIKLDAGSGAGDLTEEEMQNQRKVEEALHAGSL